MSIFRQGSNRPAPGAAAVTVVLWASAFVAIRSAGGHFSPGALALGRLLVASLALGVMWLASGDGWPPRAAWPGILGSGVLWFGLYMIALNWGEREVDAGTAAMVVTVGPILIALLGGWLLREGFPRRLGAGMAVSLAGAIVVGIAESGGGRTSVIGVVLCVAAAVCYAAGVVFQKPALGHASAVQVTTFGCFAGTTTELLGHFRSIELPASMRRRSHVIHRCTTPSRPRRIQARWMHEHDVACPRIGGKRGMTTRSHWVGLHISTPGVPIRGWTFR